ncbi:MAG TPA: ABC transporter permease [Terriglobales bacterium]|nr:ABC transporter permease [Terriglobales bacterium]
MALLQNVQFGWRMMRRTPGFTALAVVVLALGIGANTAIFSLVDAIMLAPLPLAQPQQLVQLYETESAPGSFPLTGPDYLDWQAQSHEFAAMTLYNYPRDMNYGGKAGAPERVMVVPAQANFFSLLGVKPELGRAFQTGEDQAGKNHVAVVSHNFWESHLGGDPAAVGHSIELDGESYTVIGVAPASFRLQPQTMIWTAQDMSSKALGPRGQHQYSGIGRMKPGVTLAAAQAEISAIAGRLAKEHDNPDIGARLFLLRDRLLRAPQRSSLLTLAGVVGMVLLIACANIANLLLARALGRQKEMAIRMALGAQPGQIVRQLLTESVMLALVGAALGTGIAWFGVHAVVGMKAFTLPQYNAITINAPVLAFTIGLALLAGILFGLAPALQLARPRLNAELAGAGATAGAGRRRRWLGDALIMAEIALSLLLVAAAGLFIQSFIRMRSSSIGVNPNQLLTASVTLPDKQYATDEQQQRFNQALLDRLSGVPGILSVSDSSELPIEGGRNGYITLKGHSARDRSLVEATEVSNDYFATMGIPLTGGAAFDAADQRAWFNYDRLSQAPADLSHLAGLNVIVNQAFADHYFAGKSAIGQQFQRGDQTSPWLTIKAVAANVAIQGLGDGAVYPQAYYPATGLSVMHLAVRTALPRAAAVSALRSSLAALDPSLPVYNVRTMEQVADEAVGGQAFQEWLMSGFAGLALLLAVAGIYGVMAYQVAARNREIGVRMALGASRRAVVGLVLGHGLRLAAGGIALGTVAAVLTGHVLASQLYHTAPTDPATLAWAAAVLLAACLLACAIPARRAASLDPNQALR